MDTNNVLEAVDISQLEIVEDKMKLSELKNTNLEVECAAESESSSRRSCRNKLLMQQNKNNNRRVKLTPKKLPEDLNSKILINYYLNKKVKNHTTHLETIFEDPTSKDTIMSRRKFSRCLHFPIEISTVKNKNKVKKRSMKAKQRGIMKPKKLPMELLLQKLANIETEDSC